MRKALLFILLTMSVAWGDDLHPYAYESPARPTLDYFTYLGGKSNEKGTVVAVDLSGNLYVGGVTWSADFPVVNAHQPVCGIDLKCHDAFLAKLDASGRKLLFSTFIDEGNVEIVTGIATDGQGDIYICAQYVGTLAGRTIPVKTVGNRASVIGFAPDPAGGFVARFDASGKQIYRTQLRGRGFSAPEGIAVDASGNVYVTGWAPTDASHIGQKTSFRTFFTTERCGGGFAHLVGERDAFIVKLDSSGRIAREFFFGGSGDDAGYAIALDHAGYAYVTGSTASKDLPGGAMLQIPGVKSIQKQNADDTDLFVAKVDLENGKLVYADVFGGSSKDVAYAIALDNNGKIYVAGGTASSDFPGIHPIQESLAGEVDPFVARLSNDGSRLTFSTYLGAGRYDVAMGIALDGEGVAYVIGTTESPDFPPLRVAGLKDGCPPDSKCSDAFIAMLDTNDDSIIVKGRFGGQKEDRATGVAIDKFGAVYVVGSTNSPELGTGTALRRSLAGVGDAFLVKFNGFGSLKPPSCAPGDISPAGLDSMPFQASGHRGR